MTALQMAKDKNDLLDAKKQALLPKLKKKSRLDVTMPNSTTQTSYENSPARKRVVKLQETGEDAL